MQALQKTLACDLSPTAEEPADYVVTTASEPFDITLLQVSLAGYYPQAIDLGPIRLATKPAWR